ncbi:MAG TPA: hypothetical protein VD788_04725, partial [Candidatus Polarisedimenticolaceae bacterium]|nr:hypothetical protein [Candidatus Polarisedimenticolaceae bacterium]
HLDKGKGQDDPLNRAILEVLEKVADLEDAGDAEMEEVAIHASAIRNAFFDDRKRMEDVIPPVLLVSVKESDEILPRRTAVVARAGRRTTSLTRGSVRRSASTRKKTTRKQR